MSIAPQLAFNGDCRQAFETYASLLRGEITVMNSFGGTDAALPPGSVAASSESIRYAEVRLPHGVLRGNDVPADQFVPMQGFSLSLHVASVSEAERIFAALADGGRVTTALTEVPWAERFGMLVDRFGVPWLILAQTA